MGYLSRTAGLATVTLILAMVAVVTAVGPLLSPIAVKAQVRMTVPPQSEAVALIGATIHTCLLYTSPSPRDGLLSRMPSSA